jgi:hypothetical protein
MFRSVEKMIDATVVGMDTIVDIEIQRNKEGLKVECLMLESFPNPDRNSVPSKNFLK